MKLTFLWYFLYGLEHEEKKSEKLSITPNGTLTFYPVVKEDEGMYQCEANNGIGKAKEKLITLKIHGKNQLIYYLLSSNVIFL